MASVMTIEGPGDLGRHHKGKRCKRVHNKKTGCSIELCHVGKRWKFMKGTSRCKR